MATEPKELGILFRGDMVRAILAGEKVETRRGVKPQPPPECSINFPLGNESWLPSEKKTPSRHYWEAWSGDLYENRPALHLCGSFTARPRYGPIGRRLWVRETWRPWIRAWSSHVQYAADGRRGPSLGSDESDAAMKVADKNGGHFDDGRLQNPAEVKWRPSLLMPRWASRIDLRVTSIRAERLTEIDADGVRREGFVHAGLGDTPEDYCRGYREINGLAADADPWVWVIGFSVEVPNAG